MLTSTSPESTSATAPRLLMQIRAQLCLCGLVEVDRVAQDVDVGSFRHDGELREGRGWHLGLRQASSLELVNM
jgi:hypothetical protein